MNFILLILFGFSCIAFSKSRLIENSTERSLTTKPKSSPPVRLTRNIKGNDYEDYKEEVESGEHSQPSGERTKQAKPERSTPRMPRSASSAEQVSGDRIDEPKKNVTPPTTSNPISSIRPKQKTTLIKKPIPKYNDMDYDEDFQMKMSKLPVNLIESGEHEDEDFNLNDYDFDVNHDEFAGRGKPLEPRVKNKDYKATKQENKEGSENKYKPKASGSSSHRGSPKKRSVVMMETRIEEIKPDEVRSVPPLEDTVPSDMETDNIGFKRQLMIGIGKIQKGNLNTQISKRSDEKKEDGNKEVNFEVTKKDNGSLEKEDPKLEESKQLFKDIIISEGKYKSQPDIPLDNKDCNTFNTSAKSLKKNNANYKVTTEAQKETHDELDYTRQIDESDSEQLWRKIYREHNKYKATPPLAREADKYVTPVPVHSPVGSTIDDNDEFMTKIPYPESHEAYKLHRKKRSVGNEYSVYESERKHEYNILENRYYSQEFSA